ncbi:MAG: ATP-binding protein [Methylococcaceae bacterium]|nr:ATP-binding protein [Methylococcaceae bacterium]
MQTNLQGRLRNTDLPKSHGLLPVIEAVVNSIHSLEEKGNLKTDGKITLKIERKPKSNLYDNDIYLNEIIGFIIEDNGIGFNDNNLASFNEFDSEYKLAKGCRGVGRLLWLKAFERIEINSGFQASESSYRRRKFSFDSKNGISIPQEIAISGEDIKTTVHLQEFNKKYQANSPKTIDSIARTILEHCLWYFVRPQGFPKIIIKDDDSGASLIDLTELYDSFMYESAKNESIKIKEFDFELTHIKFRASLGKKHIISLCAASRLVKEEDIGGKIPGLFGKISDSLGEFTYSCYVSSSYLDDRVRPERTSFNLTEQNVDDHLSDSELSLNEIIDQVIDRTKDYLKVYLQQNIEKGKNRVDTFISEKAPRYRPIIQHISEIDLAIDPAISDKDLDIHLHKQLAAVERDMLRQGHEIMANFDNDFDDYQKRLQEYLRTAEEIKKSDLANYVSHRRVIIDLLAKATKRTDTGCYAREDLIHNLIMPMQKDSNEVLQDSCNLWLIDERLAFHNYLSSDKTLNSLPITGDSTAKSPDLCALNVYDNPILVSEKQSLPLASITVIEIKRPMRNDAKAGEDKDPIEQALGYLGRIREGGVRTADGRPIPESKEIPGYCYVVADLTPTVINRCKLLGMTVTSDHMGYFHFNPNFKAYIEVISYDKLVNAAKERNRAFFDKLGLPST